MNIQELDLDIIFDRIWSDLSSGAESSKSSFHLASLGTVKDNCPKVRTVVLRKALMNENSIIFHTDIRSDKYSEIKSNSNVVLQFYSTEDKIQIRLEGTASLHVDDLLADTQWKSSSLSSRKCYLAEPGPGTKSSDPVSGIPDTLEGRIPTEEEAEGGRKNFCAVKIKVINIDWLYLSSSGHVRAEFSLEDGDIKAGWKVP